MPWKASVGLSLVESQQESADFRKHSAIDMQEIQELRTLNPGTSSYLHADNVPKNYKASIQAVFSLFC